MSSVHTVLVPDLGDFDDVEIIEVEVSVGDTIAMDAPLITLETDKATMDVPSDIAGVVTEILVSTGDRVSQGTPIVKVEAKAEATGAEPAAADVAPAAAAPAATPATVAPAMLAVTVPDIGDFSDVEVIDVLIKVGDEVAAEDPLITLETDKASMDVPSPAAGRVTAVAVNVGDKVSQGSPVATIEGVAAPSEGPSAAPAPAAAPAQATTPSRATPPPSATAPTPVALPPIDESTFGLAHAGPSTRKFARELGVDLARVNGSGVKGRITTDDIKRFVKAIMAGGGPAPTGPALPEVPKVDFAKYGEIEEVALTRVQKISGSRLQASWINLPHVTQHDDADFTDTEAFRKANKAAAAEKGIKLTPLAFIMRACVLALDEFPRFNTSLNAAGDALVHKKYVHMGFAADTDDGLLVPVVHDAHTMDVFELAGRLAELAAGARDGALKAKDMQGGTFTISSLGGIGGKYFTPIINAPEVAILGVSRSTQTPVYDGENFVPRLMLPLSLSYDHRVIDGALAARFITRLGQLLADPDALTAPVA